MGSMRFVIFGLTVSSSWGNGHATLWRGLLRALARRGHAPVFFERDVPFYAAHRDLETIEGADLVLYEDWPAVRDRAASAIEAADVAIVTSYCPDALPATDLVLDARGSRLRVFYDLDAPVTLRRVREGLPVDYLGRRGLAPFDLVLSYAGGAALPLLRKRLHACRVAPLYGSVDPEVHRPVSPVEEYRSDLSYLGTHAEDRQDALERLFLVPARRRPDRRFMIGGSGYPKGTAWPSNVRFVRHVPPPEHARFYSSSRLSLNLTRGPMLETGFCPSGRLFEAAACAGAILSDAWEGLDHFFEPGREILVARSAHESAQALEIPPERLLAIGLAARRRALAEHTADRRAAELEEIVAGASAARAVRRARSLSRGSLRHRISAGA
jgi:spore maturation protein CgeB